MEPVVGVEPTTDGLQNRCSTTELNWRPAGTGFINAAASLVKVLGMLPVQTSHFEGLSPFFAPPFFLIYFPLQVGLPSFWRSQVSTVTVMVPQTRRK
jgi:hypothetical protein